MIDWIDFFYMFMIGGAMLLSMMGLWFVRIMPGIDRWSRRFFRCYFLILMVSPVPSIVEVVCHYVPVPQGFFYLVLYLESIFIPLPLLMLTVLLLHCSGEYLRGSRLFYAMLMLWAVELVLLALDALSLVCFSVITPDGQWSRSPLYPLLLLPIIAVLLLTLAGAVRRRKRLSHKTFLSFLVAILPITGALLVQLFVDVFVLIDICFVLSALAMFSLILSDQIEQDLMRQREIANQRASIMVLQMRPHFIYNTLMSIYSLINLDPQKARQVTMDFTNYLRRNFNAVASENPVPFTVELEHTQAYLAVEQAQHEEMLLVAYDTQFTRFRLPALTLQPIVENAVKHGMNPYAGPLHVSIRTCRVDAASVITVEDDGVGFDAENHPESHTTLTNIRQRLKLMCGGKMEIRSREGQGTVVTVTIPDPDVSLSAH